MPGNRRSCPGVWGEASGDPCEGSLLATVPIAERRQAAVGGVALIDAAHEGLDGFWEYYESLSKGDQGRLYAYMELATYDAVRAGVPLFRSLLVDGDGAVRAWAASVLAWFPEDASDSLSALADAGAALDDPSLAATALVATGLLGGRPGPAALEDPERVVRWGAAIAFATVDGDHTRPEVVAELLLQLAGEPEDKRIPFVGGDLYNFVVQALSRVGPSHADTVFEGLLRRLPQVSGDHALMVLWELLALAFPAGPLPSDTPFTSLDDRQGRLVLALAELAWPTGVTLSYFAAFIRHFGLPSTVTELQSYLGE